MHLVYPSKFCISIVFNFSWDDCNTEEKLEAMGILWALWKGPVHTSAFSKVCIFLVIKNASINSRSHYRSDAFLTVHTKTFQKDRIARCDVSWTLWYFRSSFSSWCVFDRPHHYDMYVFSFRSIFKNVFKSMRFRWKRSACGQNA